jgi:hypothetical protein
LSRVAANAVRAWPALMKPATARAYLDNMSAEKFRAKVAPFVPVRRLGERDYYPKEELDAFIHAPSTQRGVDGAPGASEPSPQDYIERVKRDLAERKGRQARPR